MGLGVSNMQALVRDDAGAAVALVAKGSGVQMMSSSELPVFFSLPRLTGDEHGETPLPAEAPGFARRRAFGVSSPEKPTNEASLFPTGVRSASFSSTPSSSSSSSSTAKSTSLGEGRLKSNLLPHEAELTLVAVPHPTGEGQLLTGVGKPTGVELVLLVPP